MTNSIIKIEALKIAISRTKHGVTRINDVVRDVNTVWTDAGEPYPLPFGEYKRRTWLLADLERMLAQMIDEAHAEALEENYRFGWLTNRFNLFWGGCDFSTRRSMTERAHDEALVINAEMAQREMKLNAIWRGTHRDYRSSTDGVRSIMVCRGATCLVPLSELTDKEINQRSNLWK
ncbi:hypothetical protein [Citrobacter freundii]|uniref:hypothetical protein n=1 Tax=Citrobacter freundii TaxID=546 RepID=UPI0037CAD471